MEMEDKESTESGSPGGNSEGETPPSSGGAYGGHGGRAYGDSGGGADDGGVNPEVINMAVDLNMEKTVEVTNSPSVAVGGGAVGDGGGVSGGNGVVSGGVAGGPGGIVRVAGGESLMGKKKRGRPRKYDSDGNLRVAYMRSQTGLAAQTPPQHPGFTLSTPPSSGFYSSGSKKGRDKPPSSANWQILASLGQLFGYTAGGDFTPHVVTVDTGEDVAGKILTFAQKGSRGICVLSANGSVSNVTIRQPGSSGGLLTYEGRFEILTLTGSFTISDSSGKKGRTGGLSVSLASSDGRVIGGGVAGLLMAASPIQLVVGSFMPNGYKKHGKKHQSEPRIAPIIQGAPVTVTAAIPLSQAAPESNNILPVPTSQLLVQIPGETVNSLSNKDNPNSASTDTGDWNGGSGSSSDQRPATDINVSIAIVKH